MLGICVKHISFECGICRREKWYLETRDNLEKRISSFKKQKIFVDNTLAMAKEELADLDDNGLIGKEGG